jgi:hypothetical protein
VELGEDRIHMVETVAARDEETEMDVLDALFRVELFEDRLGPHVDGVLGDGGRDAETDAGLAQPRHAFAPHLLELDLVEARDGFPGRADLVEQLGDADDLRVDQVGDEAKLVFETVTVEDFAHRRDDVFEEFRSELRGLAADQVDFGDIVADPFHVRDDIARDLEHVLAFHLLAVLLDDGTDVAVRAAQIAVAGDVHMVEELLLGHRATFCAVAKKPLYCPTGVLSTGKASTGSLFLRLRPAAGGFLPATNEKSRVSCI